MNERAEQTGDVLGKLTVLGSMVLPLNIVTGMWGYVFFLASLQSQIVLTLPQYERLGSGARRRGQPDLVLRNVRLLRAVCADHVVCG